MRMPLWPSLWLLALLGGMPAGSRAGPSPGEGDPDPRLSTRLRRVESAFRNGTAGTLRGSFSPARVEVDLKGLDADRGSYAPGQLEAIFRHIFAEFETQEFNFDKGDVKVSSPGTAFARGRWVTRHLPGGPEAQHTLTFTLREESGDWRILEIRSSH
jgi:hypothetical protein